MFLVFRGIFNSVFPKKKHLELALILFFQKIQLIRWNGLKMEAEAKKISCKLLNFLLFQGNTIFLVHLSEILEKWFHKNYPSSIKCHTWTNILPLSYGSESIYRMNWYWYEKKNSFWKTLYLRHRPLSVHFTTAYSSTI